MWILFVVSLSNHLVINYYGLLLVLWLNTPNGIPVQAGILMRLGWNSWYSYGALGLPIKLAKDGECYCASLFEKGTFQLNVIARLGVVVCDGAVAICLIGWQASVSIGWRLPRPSSQALASASQGRGYLLQSLFGKGTIPPLRHCKRRRMDDDYQCIMNIVKTTIAVN